MYLVKWENYEEPTWEPKSNIPQFIINFYEKSGQSTIPSARVKHTKVVGTLECLGLIPLIENFPRGK